MATKPKSHEQEMQEIRESNEAAKKAGLIALTQKEQRELERKKKEEDKKLAGLTQYDILKRCLADGECKVTIETLRMAFPKMVSPINGNNFMLGIKDKEFGTFLQVNGLRFTLPDYIFKKTV